MSTYSIHDFLSLAFRNEIFIKPEIQDPPASKEYPIEKPKGKTPKKPQTPKSDTFPEREPWRSPETEPSRHRIQEPD